MEINKSKDISHKYAEISSARICFLLAIFFFLFFISLLLMTFVSDFSDVRENILTLSCISLSIFFSYKLSKNIKYLKYFYRMDLCHTTIEVIAVIVLCLLIFVMSFANVIFLLTAAGLKEMYKIAISERLSYIQQQIPYDISYLNSNSLNEEQFAETLFNDVCNVKKAYYLTVDDVKTSQFSKNEIHHYNLKRYVKRPTVRGEDGMIYSLVKYKEGCMYIDIDKPYNSDCVLEIDINGFKEPNNEKTDRLIFVIKKNSLMPSKVTQKLIQKRKNRM